MIKASWTFQQGDFVHQPVALQRGILEYIYRSVYGSTEGLSFRHLETIRLFCMTGGSGKKKLFGTLLTVEHHNNTILFHYSEKIKTEAQPIKKRLPIPGKIQYGEYLISAEFIKKRTTADSASIYIEAENTLLPLGVRTWKTGDSFRPLGMKGSKKLQDFFTDLKIPLRTRTEIPVITDRENRVIAVYNLRIDDRVRIKDQTDRIVKISFRKI